MIELDSSFVFKIVYWITIVLGSIMIVFYVFRILSSILYKLIEKIGKKEPSYIYKGFKLDLFKEFDDAYSDNKKLSNYTFVFYSILLVCFWLALAYWIECLLKLI